MRINISSLRCGECGHKGLKMTNLSGWYRTPYRDIPNLLLTSDIELPVCPHCKNVVFFGDHGKKLDMALASSLEDLTIGLLKEVMRAHKITAKQLSKVIGVTPEYLSMLQNRKKHASFQLVQLLLVLKNEQGLYEKLSDHWNIS